MGMESILTAILEYGEYLILDFLQHPGSTPRERVVQRPGVEKISQSNYNGFVLRLLFEMNSLCQSGRHI